MSAAMLHGLGDCTPALHCGCLRPETRERYAMEKLLTFVNARLDEDEAMARAALSNQADPENGWGYEDRALTPHVGVIHEPAQAAHIVRHDPVRVLRDVEVTRHLLELHYSWNNEAERAADAARGALASNALKWMRAVERSKVNAAEAMLRVEARRWADHPDYQEAVA